MIPVRRYKSYFYLTSLLYSVAVIIITSSLVLSEEEMDISADNVTIYNEGSIIIANGNIKVKSKKFLSLSDKFIYDKSKEEIKASGNIIIKDSLKNYYYFNNLASDKDFNNAIGSDPKIKFNSGARIVGNLFTRTNSNINVITNASYTPCLQKNYIKEKCPGWKLNAKKVVHDTKRNSIYYESAVLRVLNIPVFYTPFFSHPDPTVNKKTGLLMPNISDDNILGTSISIPFFYNISSNYDITFTPTIQTKADDYYSINYRHLTQNHKFNLDGSLSNNESNTGTKNHIFINGNIINPFGKFDYKVETSNNDTYLRKNHINEQTILTSGISFSKEMENSYLDFSSYIYKHLNNSIENKWEYIYPIINFDIYNYKDPVYGLDWKIENSLLNYRDINKNINQQISSEISSKKIKISKKTGLKFENTIQNRIIYFNNSENDLSQIRVFPQLASKISYPLSRNINGKSELLEPIIMPIIAPYNNYSNDQNISNGNLFDLNRETSLSQWESGPRVNYGINWLISNNDYNINTSIGQSAKINKDNLSNNSSEISNYFIGNTFDFGSIGYFKTDITIDRKNIYLKDNNISSSIKLGKVKFGFDYDYETLNKTKTSEQISVGAKIDFVKDTNLIMSIRKDLMSEKSIGNAIGLHYENDCLAINFDYYKDFTAIDDIKNSRGFSFTITLKPFGSSKQAGKVKNFGPDL